MEERPFTPKDALNVAKAAGLDTRDLERQVEQTQGDASLRARVEELEQRIEELTGQQEPEEQSTPEDPQLAEVKELASALGNARSKWHGDANDAA